MSTTHETNWDLVVSGEELKEVAAIRTEESIKLNVETARLDEYLNSGWSLKKRNKRKSTVIKPKKIGDAFEDEVWSIFYKMGFKYMNKNNSFKLLYSKENGLSKQIDIIAIDDEVCLIIECKEASKYGTKRNFQMDIGEIGGIWNKIFDQVRQKYPAVKCKYIWATKNIVLGQQDKNRLAENKIIHFDYSTILYYKALVEHLGGAAKYQLLGHLFAGQRINNMDVEIPAIRGKMGKHTYYSFVMQPEQLLKIAYILHRTNANNDYEELLPSYQRLIKKDRLLSVRKFINEGNYFPNSLVISIDTKKKDLQFDLAPDKFNQNKLMKMGTLHLPQIYQSAYIIDGQHRLYGYSDSEHSSDNSIPVVAFENLKKTEQLKLFMDINQNQKPVPKALKNILAIDIDYDSDNPKLAQSALLGKIAKRLGEDTSSPLKGRIVIGEDATTKRCCITIENIKLALEKTSFFNKLTRGGQQGIFDKSNNDETLNIVYPLLCKFFTQIKNEFQDDWEKDDSFLVINNLIGGLIRILNDIIVIQHEKDPTIIEDMDRLWSACKEFVELMLLALADLSPEERVKIRTAKGGSAPGEVWRLLQMKMFELDSSFSNADIENYYTQTYKNYNEDAKPQVIQIKKTLISNIQSIFHENNWMRKHLSEQHENELIGRIHAKNNAYERNGSAQRIDAWDEVGFGDIKKMVDHASNWSTYFKDLFAQWIPNCTKIAVMSLLTTIDRCNTNINGGHKINGNDYAEINKFYSAIERTIL